MHSGATWLRLQGWAVPDSVVLCAGVAVLFLLVCTWVLVRARRRDARTVAGAQLGAPVVTTELPILRYDDDEEGDKPFDDGNEDDLLDDSCPALPFAFDAEALDEEDTAVEPLFRMQAVARSDRGRVRKNNEDKVLVASEQGLCVVADGLGGHAGGQVASELAVETIAKALEDRVFQGRKHDTLPPRGSEVVRAIQMASTRILDVARERPEFSSMGTTVVAARFSPDKRRLYVGHVGDSRCYRFRDGLLEQMTRDHTMAGFGIVGKSAGFLSRVVGANPRVLTDLVVATPRVGDIYLLCSDGLTKALPNDLIADVLGAILSVDRAADCLVELANMRGGRDNISVVLVRIAPVAHAAA
jgi:protein phosphatase